ncbi:MAG TPA: hypothetical protein VGI74_09805 [Streptosporangiaceae bacterium]
MSGGDAERGHGAVEDDHWVTLRFSSAGNGSRGICQPGVFDLHLRSGEELTDQLVHHHQLQTAGADWSGTTPALRLVLLDLMRTESYVDPCAWSDHRS